jgi:hypothetical protein
MKTLIEELFLVKTYYRIDIFISLIFDLEVKLALFDLCVNYIHQKVDFWVTSLSNMIIELIYFL